MCVNVFKAAFPKLYPKGLQDVLEVSARLMLGKQHAPCHVPGLPRVWVQVLRASLQSPCLTSSVCAALCVYLLLQWYYQQFGDFLMDSPPQWFRILIL